MKLEPSTEAPFVTKKLVHACVSMFNRIINIAKNIVVNFFMMNFFFTTKIQYIVKNITFVAIKKCIIISKVTYVNSMSILHETIYRSFIDNRTVNVVI